jgi:aspartate kinase
MGLVVQKYGGTSVAPNRIRHVAERVAKIQLGEEVAVVVSAMAGETDRLVGLATRSLQSIEREMDLLLSSENRLRVRSCLNLAGLGVQPGLSPARQVGIITEVLAGRIERISWTGSGSFERRNDSGCRRFQSYEKSDVTTLGRGGSDLTAVALAVALRADVCDIFTDVDGVYTTDPNVVPTARKLDKISYEEMMEMASLGARCFRPVRWVAVKYQIRSACVPVLMKGWGP